MKKLLTVFMTLLIAFSLCSVIKADDVDVEGPDACSDGCGATPGSGIWDDDEHTNSWDENGNFTGKSYSSLQEAFDNVKNGGTITVTYLEHWSTDYKSQSATVPEGKTINLYILSFLGNFNGEPVIINNGNLTIEMDSSSLLYSSGENSIINNGTLTIKSGTFSNDVTSLLGEGYKTSSVSRTFYFLSSGDGSGDNDYQEKSFGGYEIIKDVEDNEIVLNNKEALIVNKIDESTKEEGFDSNLINDYEIVLNESNAPTGDEKQKFDNAIEDVNKDYNKYGYKISDVDYVWLDIDVYAIDSAGKKAKVTELDNYAEITIYLDNETLAKVQNKVIYIARYHDNDVKMLTYASLNGNALSFESNKFSKYSLVYFNVEENNNNTDKPSTPSDNTNSNTSSTTTRTEANTPCEEWYNSKNWTWSESANQCVYKVKNTSAK